MKSTSDRWPTIYTMLASIREGAILLFATSSVTVGLGLMLAINFGWVGTGAILVFLTGILTSANAAFVMVLSIAMLRAVRQWNRVLSEQSTMSKTSVGPAKSSFARENPTLFLHGLDLPEQTGPSVESPEPRSPANSGTSVR